MLEIVIYQDGKEIFRSDEIELLQKQYKKKPAARGKVRCIVCGTPTDRADLIDKICPICRMKQKFS